ncbi:MAG: polysaccharide deacetylase family protein [Candidatus Polarisedimenticolia bacterium]
MNPLKKGVLRVACSRTMRRLYAPLLRNRAAILMFHRFACPDAGVEGHSPATLRAVLERLRRDRYRVVGLADLFAALDEGRVPEPNTLAFTIDDGYWDQAEIGGAVFAEYDCPVTTFATTGFLDGTLWFWWDRVDYVLRRTARPSLEASVGNVAWRAATAGDADRRRARAEFVALCKSVSEEDKLAAIERLAERAEVALPSAPPLEYAPLSWTDLPRYEARGMTFGPHSVTHPVLSRVGDEQSRGEIEGSWRTLRDRASRPAPIFCYPNGKATDFGPRETRLLAEVGLRGAVTGVSGYATAAGADERGDCLYRVRRFAYEAHPLLVLQCASGFERVKQLIRREA